MKSLRRSLILLILPVLGAIARAQSQQPGLTPEQQRAFDARRLVIRPIGAGAAADTGGMAWAAGWNRWTAFEGPTRIGESEFFRRTGFPRQAALADEWRRGARAPMVLGVALCLAGTGLMVAGAVEDDWRWRFTGLTIAAGAMGIAVPAWRRLRQNRFPLATAEGIADAYNAGLRERIVSGALR